MEKIEGKIIVTKPMVGICFMQVCAEKGATDEEILHVCNTENPSGTSNGWTGVIREGDGKPVQCEADQDREHILVSC